MTDDDEYSRMRQVELCRNCRQEQAQRNSKIWFILILIISSWIATGILYYLGIGY